MMCQRSQCVHSEKEEVLDNDRGIGQSSCCRAILFRICLFDLCPCQIDIEEQQKCSDSKNGRVQGIIWTTQPVEEQMSVDLSLVLAVPAS